MSFNKKKILFLSPLPPPNYGSALSSKDCLEILKKSKKFSVESIKLNYSREMTDVGKISLEKIKGFFSVLKIINQKISNFKPHFVYFVPATSNFGLIRDFFFVRFIKKSKIPILFHIRSRLIKNRLNNFFYKFMFSNEKAIILGKSLIEDIINYIPKKNLFILPNAIKNEISDKELKKILEKRRSQKIFNILFLSNMDKTKGWPKLLESARILMDRGFSFNCFFAGSWQNKEDECFFFNYLKKNNLEDVVFYIGQIKPEEKKDLFSKVHLLVFPTEYPLETFGRVIIEAMMYALPVIANSIATIPSIIEDKKTGFLLNENSPIEISERIETLLKNRKLAEKKGLNGRKAFLKKFEIKNYEKNFLEILSFAY
ncbi:MAG: glycosyltransferase family 4 protein [Candidatus Pacearchaeota archaeon]